MKKYIIALAACIVLCVPAFASSPTYFANNEIIITSGENVNTYSGDNVSFFVRYNNNTTDYRVYAISETSTTFRYETLDVNLNCSTTFGDYFISGALVGASSATTNPLITYFGENANDADIQAAYADFIENPNGTPDTVYNFNLPRGNVLYFQVSSESDVNITSYMETLSLIVNGQSSTYGPWGDTGQRFGPAAALPTSGTTFPLLSQDPIHWNKDASQNVLGQTKIGRKTVHCITGQWYCFYNPNANHVEGGDPYQANVGATVNFKGSFSQIKVYPVSQKLSVVNGDLYSGSDNDFESFYDGTLNENGTVSWTNQDGNVESPTAGGQNFQDGPQTADSLLEQIKITLSTVVSELQTLFTFGYEAIQSLVGLMRDFVSVFSGLYTWLPAPIYSALMSAVVVAIVIGVFKVFL